ncbi:cytochrome c oxidase subunit II transmembrane domain-containing protein [Candidatus Accumulibacter aalborgensis]|nr:cytochrome c oxidase subunit II transmembrane domain-containing protein [Candidatus Accumulibacter aalborgensis]
MTPISRDALQLHNDFMLVITALFIVVFGIMIYTMVRHRRRAGYRPTKFTGPTGTVQWLWAMVPFAILLFVDYALMGLN